MCFHGSCTPELNGAKRVACSLPCGADSIMHTKRLRRVYPDAYAVPLRAPAGFLTRLFQQFRVLVVAFAADLNAVRQHHSRHKPSSGMAPFAELSASFWRDFWFSG